MVFSGAGAALFAYFPPREVCSPFWPPIKKEMPPHRNWGSARNVLPQWPASTTTTDNTPRVFSKPRASPCLQRLLARKVVLLFRAGAPYRPVWEVCLPPKAAGQGFQTHTHQKTPPQSEIGLRKITHNTTTPPRLLSPSSHAQGNWKRASP